MALVKYNGLALPYCDVTDFRMEAIADPSDTDRILTKFHVGVQTVINADFINSFQSALPGPTIDNPVAATQYIYQTLMARRKQLSVTFNGVEMIPERQQGVRGYVDAANGPVPKFCNLIPVDGMTNTTFLLFYEIEASYWVNQNLDDQNVNKNLPGNVVLYNRWSESVEIDDQNRTTKTREGKLMIRSDNIKGWIADQTRNSMAVTSLPPGRFLRKSSNYVVSEDGLGLRYRIVDQEVWRMPPSPAYKSEAKYIETGTRADGKRYGTCSCRLWGDNITSQAELIKVASGICYVKLKSRGSQLENPKVKLRGTVMANLLEVSAYENYVSYRMDVLYPAVRGVVASAALWPDPKTQPVYYTRGTASLLLQAAKYYDPSLQNTVLGPGTETVPNALVSVFDNVQLNKGVQPGEAGLSE